MSQVLEIVSTLDSSRFHARFQTEPKPRISVAWRQLATNTELLCPICKHNFTRSKINLECQQSAVNILGVRRALKGKLSGGLLTASDSRTTSQPCQDSAHLTFSACGGDAGTRDNAISFLHSSQRDTFTPRTQAVSCPSSDIYLKRRYPEFCLSLTTLTGSLAGDAGSWVTYFGSARGNE